MFVFIYRHPSLSYIYLPVFIVLSSSSKPTFFPFSFNLPFFPFSFMPFSLFNFIFHCLLFYLHIPPLLSTPFPISYFGSLSFYWKISVFLCLSHRLFSIASTPLSFHLPASSFNLTFPCVRLVLSDQSFY